MNAGDADLAALQRFLQEAIVERDGVRRAGTAAVEAVIRPSQALSASERLEVYARMYRLRLVEVLQDEFPALRHQLGAEDFDALARRYAHERPSTSPTLNRFGAAFPDFVAEALARDARAGLAAGLARLERAIQELRDDPTSTRLDVDALLRLSPERWYAARFRLVSELRLLSFTHPVDAAYRSWKRGEPIPPGAPEASWLCVYRDLEHRVWRLPLDRPRYVLLEALRAGMPLSAALETLLDETGAAPEEIGAALGEWFRAFASDGLFAAVLEE